jgi:hypothetical protein
MLPMMVLMAIIIGGMYAAIDTTAGERERGSLEPLMMNPVSGWQLAIGKWGAVAAVGMGVVVLTIFSFFPSQWLIKNDTLRAEFQFGIKDAIGFLMVLLPLAASMAALQIAIALDCKSYKEAQVRNQIVTMFIPFCQPDSDFVPGARTCVVQMGAGAGAESDDESGVERRGAASADARHGACHLRSDYRDLSDVYCAENAQGSDGVKRILAILPLFLRKPVDVLINKRGF